jgi:nicotinate phosphoribosyltransferase
LDSGDLADHARTVRRILDEGGLPDAEILVSGNLDEYRLRDLVQNGAPIDSFAVGTAMTTSSDAPSLDCAYKLQEYAGRPCRKRSEGKATWPGRKQVFRFQRSDGHLDHDVVTTHNDQLPGEPMLHPVMKEGRRLASAPDLAELRLYAAAQLGQLPGRLRALEPVPAYDVRISPALQMLTKTVDLAPNIS